MRYQECTFSLSKHLLLSISSFLVLFGLSNQLQAQEFSSGDKQVPLIELYTSEGCSSCPPADRWLSSLVDDQGLWSEFVPAAFHVDYWDYIGWKDRFANKQYSQRQRRYAREFGESTVYTPGVRKAGEEWRSWRLFGKPANKNAIAVGNLDLVVSEDGKFTANFNDLKKNRSQNLQLTVALLGLDLSSEVSRGENRGKKLSHDFVVLGITTLAGQTSEQPNSAFKWAGELPDKSNDAKKYAVAAWVTEGGSQVPIQVTGGELAG